MAAENKDDNINYREVLPSDLSEFPINYSSEEL